MCQTAIHYGGLILSQSNHYIQREFLRTLYENQLIATTKSKPHYSIMQDIQTKTIERRIIFVGIHNKEGFEPLDSRTPSGKLIDKVIDQLECKNVSKTNLFWTNYLPPKEQISAYNFDWFTEHMPDINRDIVVLLGKQVAEYYAFDETNVIKFPHPSPVFRRLSDSSYIQNLSQKINELCKQRQ